MRRTENKTECEKKCGQRDAGAEDVDPRDEAIFVGREGDAGDLVSLADRHAILAPTAVRPHGQPITD